jgi:hypothetical protein
LRRLARKKADSAVGISIRSNVLDAYRFLVYHYQFDDQVFLFGFSRGAYTVRALAAMIGRCGLLYPEHVNLAEYAWSVFSDEDRSRDSRRKFGGAARIQKIFGRKIGIHFVGVWDTVSSFGWFWDPLTLPDTAANRIVRHVRHALSIDERRSFFRPNFFRPTKTQDCKEVWFAGAHADVGGGYIETEAGLARISLHWMLAEAKAHGLQTILELEQKMLERIGDRSMPDHLAKQHDEFSKFLWRSLSWLPRRVFDSTMKRRWSWPNWASRRVIPEGALVHFSVKRRMNDASLHYKPQLPKEYQFVGSEWESSETKTIDDPRRQASRMRA